MRKKFYRGERLPMKLQFFAEEGGVEGGNSGGAGGEGTEGGTSGESGGEGDKTTPPSFDQVLKDGHQAEFDRRVQEAVNTARTRAQEKWQALTDDKLSEAEKLAKMIKGQVEDKTKVE